MQSILGFINGWSSRRNAVGLKEQFRLFLWLSNCGFKTCQVRSDAFCGPALSVVPIDQCRDSNSTLLVDANVVVLSDCRSMRSSIAPRLQRRPPDSEWSAWHCKRRTGQTRWMSGRPTIAFYRRRNNVVSGWQSWPKSDHVSCLPAMQTAIYRSFERDPCIGAQCVIVWRK